MTHSLHRRGNVEDLNEDYVMIVMPSKGINKEGSEEKMRQIWEVISHYEKDLANFGNHRPVWGETPPFKMEDLKKTVSWIAHAVFKDRETLKACLREFKERDFGISVIISCVYNEVEKICSEVGLFPHTVNQSLGIHGKTQKLPEEKVLEITTMCGHAMVSPHLVLQMVKEIKEGKTTILKAAQEMSRMCDCGIFNPYRAEKLLRKMTSNA